MNRNSEVYGVIMAGGRGTRFWPVSTSECPKQFLDLTGDGTMLQKTASRFDGICPQSRIIVVTGVKYKKLVMEQLPWLLPENLLLEPSGKNTAPCIGWAAGIIGKRSGSSAIMTVVPSDHVIETDKEFRKTIEIAIKGASKGVLVTIGIKPSRPATGYGYIRKGKSLGDTLFEVEEFREKPDIETAERFVRSCEYFWNAGMFVWQAGTILEEMSEYMPKLSGKLKRFYEKTSPTVSVWKSLEPESIDYGILEKSGKVAVLPASFAWDDIGDWPSARRCGIGRGRIVSIDSGDVTVWNEGKLTVLLGVSGLSVIETDDATLIMSDDYSQKLKHTVQEIEKIDKSLT